MTNNKRIAGCVCNSTPCICFVPRIGAEAAMNPPDEFLKALTARFGEVWATTEPGDTYSVGRIHGLSEAYNLYIESKRPTKVEKGLS